jgi:hypothetical protein
MSKQTTSPDFLACIPHAIEPHWDNVWARRMAGFPVNIVYAAKGRGPRVGPRSVCFQSEHVRSARTAQADAISPDGRQRLFGPGCAPSRGQN